MPTLPSKEALKQELLQKVTRDLETLEHAHLETKSAATHEEAKPENDKDTRALEQSYLARGQAQRVAELKTALLEVSAMPVAPFRAEQAISLGALITLEEDGTTFVVLLAAHGGGSTLANGAVAVVTPKSPLGRALLGKCRGDDAEVRLPERLRELSVVAVG